MAASSGAAGWSMNKLSQGFRQLRNLELVAAVVPGLD